MSMSRLPTRVAATAVASVATCSGALADVALSCSGMMDIVSRQHVSALSITFDPDNGTLAVGSAAPLPVQRDATERTVTFGNAGSSTFGILNTVTGSIFISTFAPLATYRGVCKKIAQ